MLNVGILYIIKCNSLATHVQQIADKKIITTHCIIHREELVANDMNNI